MRRHISLLLFSFLFVHSSFAQTTSLRVLLDSLRMAGNFPGLSVAIVNKENASVAFASGYNDKEKNKFLTTSDRMLQGSVGKTYASAIALQLVKKGKIQLDEKVSAYLGQYEWFHRIPNSPAITVRMLMNHTSGVMRYEFKEQFLKDLTANPSKTWKPEELLSYVLNEIPPFNAGEGWDYSDTNYILLGMIIER